MRKWDLQLVKGPSLRGGMGCDGMRYLDILLPSRLLIYLSIRNQPIIQSINEINLKSIYISIKYLHLSVYLSFKPTHLCTLSPVYLLALSLYLSVYMSICVSAYLHICLSICLCICLSLCLSICLPLYLYLPIYHVFCSIN